MWMPTRLVNFQGKKWGVEFWAQNLFNKDYVQVVADAPLQGSGTIRALRDGLRTATGALSTANQLYIAFPTEPRTYGITVKAKF
jgi:iron complex outermembrane recepter protein